VVLQKCVNVVELESELSVNDSPVMAEWITASLRIIKMCKAGGVVSNNNNNVLWNSPSSR